MRGAAVRMRGAAVSKEALAARRVEDSNYCKSLIVRLFTMLECRALALVGRSGV